MNASLIIRTRFTFLLQLLNANDETMQKLAKLKKNAINQQIANLLLQ